MKRLQVVLVACGVALATALALGQKYAPPKSEKPDEATLKQIQDKLHKLENRVAKLRANQLADAQLVEVEIFQKAATWELALDEFYDKDAADWTSEILDAGLLRASQAAQGDFPQLKQSLPWLEQRGRSVVRAYRSLIDSSIQPYAVTYPEGFNGNRSWRLDVVLHGRDPSLTEVKFLHQHNGDQPAPKDQDFVQLDIFGRGNNAYRWAGEADVFEALKNFLAIETYLGRGGLYDSSQRVLRGFSMGGAGAWHIGLHHPDNWCVVGPGAGFTSTHGYAKDLPKELPPYQEACLHIYDAIDYAENAFDVPIVAYAGSKDDQLQAAKNIEARLKDLKLTTPLKLIVGEDVGHDMPEKYRKEANELYTKEADKGRPPYPDHVHFVTYTLKYPSCDWVSIIRLDRHYEKALVDAKQEEKGFTVKTTNVGVLALDLPVGYIHPDAVIDIDGQKITAPTNFASASSGQRIYLEKRDSKWSSVLPQRILTDQLRRMQKINGMQGPIDDAFMYPFLCVVGTGKSWHEETATYALSNLQRFQAEWLRYFRGELPLKTDVQVTPEDIATKNLILFGDPASNSLIAQALDGLPLTWTKEEIVFKGKKYTGAEHVPVLVYPSPLNSGRYIVLNTGHTFHAADFKDTNAMLFPRLGDYAILKLGPTKDDPLAVSVAEAGLFDDYWKLK
jgi:hypothetical protein